MCPTIFDNEILAVAIANMQTQGCMSMNQLATENDANDNIDLGTNTNGPRS